MSYEAPAPHPIQSKLKAVYRTQFGYGTPFMDSISVSGEPAVLQFDLPKDTAVSVVATALGKKIDNAAFSEMGEGVVKDSKRYTIPVAEIESAQDIVKPILAATLQTPRSPATIIASGIVASDLTR